MTKMPIPNTASGYEMLCLLTMIAWGALGIKCWLIGLEAAAALKRSALRVLATMPAAVARTAGELAYGAALARRQDEQLALRPTWTEGVPAHQLEARLAEAAHNTLVYGADGTDDRKVAAA